MMSRSPRALRLVAQATRGFVLWAVLMALGSREVVQGLRRVIAESDRWINLLWEDHAAIAFYTAVALGAAALALAAVRAWPIYSRALRRWFEQRDRLEGHAFPLSLLLLSAISLALGRPAPAQRWAACLLLVVSSLAWCIRLVGTWRVSHPREVSSSERPLFDRIWGDLGDAPRLVEAQDALERGPLVDELGRLVASPRNSVSLGLEGSWGSGKTTLLWWIACRLRRTGHEVVWFQTWDYREPHRLVEEYFRRLGKALKAQGVLTGGGRALRRLASGLVQLSGGRAREVMHATVGDRLTESTEVARLELQAALATIEQPIVVIVDDLDRLEADELLAILRAFRLVTDLPNLKHLFAYDRDQLAKTLFPDDPGGTRARDYLAKIIQTEFTLGVPPAALAARLLDDALAPLLETLDEAARDRFSGRLSTELRRVLREALPTPREVRRVVAATAWIWQRMRRHVDLMDLFLVCVLHYRFPRTYSAVRSHREWFTENDWSREIDVLFMSQDGQLTKERERFLDELRLHTTDDDHLANRLLSALLSGLSETDDLDASTTSAGDALRERRLIHPVCFDRYFSLYIPRSEITEAEMEDRRTELGAMPPGPSRREAVTQWIRSEIADGRLSSLEFQWDVFFGHREYPQEMDADLVRDLALAIAAVSSDLGEVRPRPISGSPWVVKVAYLVSLQADDEAATELITEIVRLTERLEFSGHLVLWSLQGRWFGDRRPDGERLRVSFQEAVRERFCGEDGLALLARPPGDRDLVIKLMSSKEVAQLVLRDLQREPRLLPQLLEVFRKTVPESEGPSVGPGDLGTLAAVVPVDSIQQLTATLPPDTWSDPLERERVLQYRQWVASSPAAPEAD